MASRGLSRIVNGEIKHSAQEEKRYRGNPLRLNHQGVRSINEFPEWLAAPAMETPCESEHSTKRQKRKLLRLFLREATESDRSRKLAVQVLLKGRNSREESCVLNIKYTTARSIISRARRSLGLPGRKQRQ
jgi:DNA-directed RNA polymerase specialized sigma24 family protein